MAKTPSAKRSAGALATLNRIARQSTRTAVAKATGIPRSTLYTWSKKGVPEKARARVVKAAKVAKEELTFSKAEVAAIKKEIDAAYKIRQQGFIAKASGHSVSTIDEWVSALKSSPTTRNVQRIKDILEDARGATKKVDEGDIRRENPETGERFIVATTENYEGIAPPKDADGYRLFMVDKDGDIIASTGEGDWDDIMGDFADIVEEDEYDAQVVGAIIQLTFDV